MRWHWLGVSLIAIGCIWHSERPANSVACFEQRAEDIFAEADAVFAGDFERRHKRIKVTEAFKGVKVGDFVDTPRGFEQFFEIQPLRVFAAKRGSGGKLYINNGPDSQHFTCQSPQLERQIETLRRLARGG